jgi:hypothetical protein
MLNLWLLDSLEHKLPHMYLFFRFLKIFCNFITFDLTPQILEIPSKLKYEINTIDSRHKRILFYLRSRKQRGLLQLGLTSPWLYCAKRRLSSDQECKRLNRPLGLVHHFTYTLNWNAQRITLLICFVIWTKHRCYTVRLNVSHCTSVDIFPPVNYNFLPFNWTLLISFVH